MGSKTFLQKNSGLIFFVLSVFAGGIAGAVVMGAWGYQYGLQWFLIEGPNADLSRPGDYGMLYSFIYGSRGLLRGILIGPLVIFILAKAIYYARKWKINRQA